MRSSERIGIMNVPANLDRKQCIDFIINTKLSKYNRNALNQMLLKTLFINLTMLIHFGKRNDLHFVVIKHHLYHHKNVETP
jgi:hypothetical protein